MNKQQIKQEAIQLKTEGYSSRYIADRLGIGKSSVNEWYNQWQKNPYQLYDHKKPKILVFDLETAPSIAATFGRWKQNIGQANVIEEGGWILTAAYKWLGSNEVTTLHSKSDIINATDESICIKLWELFAEASAVIAHNSANFDYKVLQTRCALNGLPPLPAVKVIDTLVMAKKNFKFNSNRLDSLARYFGYDGKIETGGMKLWLDVRKGDDQAIEDMLEYNKHDVELLEAVYNHIKAWGHAGTNYNAANYYNDDKTRCHVCGSVDVEETGRHTHTQLSKFTEVRCNDCGAISRSRQALTTKAKRAKILVPAS